MNRALDFSKAALQYTLGMAVLPRRVPKHPMSHPASALSLATLLAVSVIAPARADSKIPNDSTPPQVIVSARRFDRRTLEKVIIPQFLQTHGARSPVIAQVGRWHEPVCARVIGLRPRFGELVAHRVEEVARRVGAPTGTTGEKCVPNVEIVFTDEPQKLIDHIATQYRWLLGYYEETHLKQVSTIDRPIQAWYVTGTKSMNGYQAPVLGLSGAGLGGGQVDPTASTVSPFNDGTQIDEPDGGRRGFGVTGTAGSHLNRGLSSEFLHALIIVDARAVSKYPLGAISDYVAVLALTRIKSLDTCSELSSIIDLLSRRCGAEATARSITTADLAFLKALYGADLEANLNVERGDMRNRMMAIIERDERPPPPPAARSR